MKEDLNQIMKDLSKIKIKNNSYTRSRGEPAMLLMLCSNCLHYIMSYQKDGPGPLIRCYLDRIHHPIHLEKRQYNAFEKKTFPKLECPNCQTVIGSPIIYEKENRPAYHLRPGFFVLRKVL